MQHPHHAVDHHGAVRRFEALCSLVVAAIKAWRRRSRTRRELRALSERELRDVGLSDHERSREAAKWFWQG
jgi:uncharacterized protein YjiS (DUF1127 family)